MTAAEPRSAADGAKGAAPGDDDEALRRRRLPATAPDSGVGYHDLFSLVGERRRPPYRWLLLGPKRSGTCVHTDPLATSAWNTVVRGKKLWVLFPPGTPKAVVKAKQQVGVGGWVLQG
jgi:histone arginine demethylase JMJD6